MLHFYLDAAAIMRNVQPDLIHIEEEPFSPACWQFVSAAKRDGKKVIFFTWENIKRKHNPVYAYFDNYCIASANAAIAGNAEGRTILREKGFTRNIEVIPQYGVNLEDFPARENKPVKGEFNIVYMGRLAPEKGVDTLVAALQGTKGFKLHIAGRGPAEARIHNETHSAGIAGQTEFHSFIDREKIPEFLSKMDILILPSVTTPLWKEQFGRVLIEAMAAKVPVIGSNSGEIPNVIDGAGLVFEEGVAVSLKSSIISLVSDEKLYAECASKGYERVKSNYTNEVIAGKLNEFYRKL
jgi:glycosyltransferase involved in cell wall biosynthesis